MKQKQWRITPAQHKEQILYLLAADQNRTLPDLKPILLNSLIYGLLLYSNSIYLSFFTVFFGRLFVFCYISVDKASGIVRNAVLYPGYDKERIKEDEDS